MNSDKLWDLIVHDIERIGVAQSSDVMEMVTEYSQEKAKAILQRILDAGHGGGNWRRVVQVELEKLGAE